MPNSTPTQAPEDGLVGKVVHALTIVQERRRALPWEV